MIRLLLVVYMIIAYLEVYMLSILGLYDVVSLVSPQQIEEDWKRKKKDLRDAIVTH